MVLNNKKGQSALEFLMTYGWAILVVLAAIGALAYFGVLNPANFLPNKCIASSGAACIGKPTLTTSNISFTLTNGLGTALVVGSENITKSTPCTSVRVCDKGGASNCIASTTGGVYNVSDTADFTLVAIGCTGATISGSSYKGTFGIPYVDTVSGLPQVLSVQISGRVQ